MPIYKKIASLMPGLEVKLTQAKMNVSTEEYIKRTIILSFFLGIAICFIAFSFTKNFMMFLSLPIIMFLSFFYLIRQADLKISKVKKEIDKEIIYAGRFLIIELESGVPIYEAFKNISKNYETVGVYFNQIVGDINFGTTLEDALNNVITTNPSPQLRKILWQMLNSLKTGANVTESLNTVLDQVVREQQIDVKEYGRKLNPMAMFYMMMAVILPSLGTTMLVVLATFMGFEVPLIILLSLVGALSFVQFMFLAFIKSSRPPMAL